MNTVAENPLFPNWLETTGSVLSVVAVILLVIAIFSVSKTMKEEKISSAAAIGVTVGMLLLPLVGPLVWFWYRRRLN